MTTLSPMVQQTVLSHSIRLRTLDIDPRPLRFTSLILLYVFYVHPYRQTILTAGYKNTQLRTRGPNAMLSLLTSDHPPLVLDEGGLDAYHLLTIILSLQE